MEKFAKIEHGAVKVETPVPTINADTTPKIVMPAKEPTNPNESGYPSDSWIPWVLGGGGALLAHAITSPMFEASEEEKRKESVWSRLLRTIIPLGVGAVGAYGGYHIGKSLEKKSQAMSTNAWDRVVGKNGRFATIAPPEHSEAIDKLLQYVDDNDSTKWEDIVRIAKELHGTDGAIEGMAGKALDWASLVPDAIGVSKAIQGTAQIYGSRPSVIQARYQKALEKIPPIRPGAAPARKWYNPFTWDMFSKNNLVKGEARKAMIANMQQAAKNRMDISNASASANAAKGWGDIRKGLVWLAGGKALDYAGDELARVAEERRIGKDIAEEFLNIQNKLEDRLRKTNVLQENVSTNAPVATAQGTAK